MTPGPWEWSPAAMVYMDSILQLGPDGGCSACFYGMDHIKSHPPAQRDADLIAAASALAQAYLDLLDRVEKVEALFAGGPETSCRTTWRAEGLAIAPVNVECVEVPMDDLRAALGGDHEQPTPEGHRILWTDDMPAEIRCPHPDGGLNCAYVVGHKGGHHG